MLRLGEKNKGQAFTVNWLDDAKSFTHYLEVMLVENPLARKGQTGHVDNIRWVYGTYSKNEKKPIWTHFTGDLGLIASLLADELSAQKSAPASSLSQMPGIQDPPKRTGHFNALRATRTAMPSLSPSKQSYSDVTLAGDLDKVELTGILQSIGICKMTGRLDIQDAIEGIEVYFQDGVPVHACQTKILNTIDDKTLTGDQVLLSALLWTEGSFSFKPERKTSERSVKRKLEILLLEGACIKDYNSYLKAAGVDGKSVLHQKDRQLSEEEFAEKLSVGMPMDSKLAKSVFDLFDGKRMLADVVLRLSLPRTTWIPVVFNLLSCNLISLSDEKQGPASKSVDGDEQLIDKAQITKAERDLARYETAMLTYPLFMLFLQREFDRSTDSRTPFSLAIFEMSYNKEGMSNEKLRNIKSCFASLAASYDLIGHYRDFEFGILLPLKSEAECREFIDVFYKYVCHSFEEAGDSDAIQMSFGIATPDSGVADLGALVKAAVKAKQTAKQRNVLCFSTRQLQWEAQKKKAESAPPSTDLEKDLELWRQLCLEAETYDKDFWPKAAERYGGLLLKSGKFTEAEPILFELVRHKTEVFGADDIATITSAGDLAHCYYALGNYDDAEWLIQGVINGYSMKYGEQCQVVATWQFNLATLYHVQQNFTSADATYKKCLSIRMHLLGPDHPETKKAQASYNALQKLMNPVAEEKKEVSLITDNWVVDRSLDKREQSPV